MYVCVLVLYTVGVLYIKLLLNVWVAVLKVHDYATTIHYQLVWMNVTMMQLQQQQQMILPHITYF